MFFLVPLTERFKRKHPEVGVQLQVENTRRCCLAVVDGDVDIAVVGGVIPKDLEHIVQVMDRPRLNLGLLVHFWEPSNPFFKLCCINYLLLLGSSSVVRIRQESGNQGMLTHHKTRKAREGILCSSMKI